MEASWLTHVGDIFLAYSFQNPCRLFTIVMSLLPVAVVVVAFFFLFRMLGGKAERTAQPQPPEPQPEPPKSHQPPQTPKRRHSSESGSRPVPIDGLASFHFVEGNPYARPTPSTPPRRHPCRVCGVPATKRCIHCKSAYYCSKEHCTQASLRDFYQKEYTPDAVAPL
jgi:hypothetical protein